MHTRVLLAFVVIAALCLPRFACGQFTDPRTYANTPADLNQLELDYAHATSNASIDTSLVISGAHLDLNQATASYTRTFGVLSSLAWIKASVPFASVSGHVSGTSLSHSVAGGADASLEIAALLVGAPALSAAEFETYQRTTTIGVSLVVTGPSGEYDPNKVVNLGSDRWSFKPQIGVSYPFGPEQKWWPTATCMPISLRITPPITARRSLASGHCRGSKHTSATTSPQISGPRWTATIASAATLSSMVWARTTHREISRLVLKRVGRSIPETPLPWYLQKPSCTRTPRLIPACLSSISTAGVAATSSTGF